jgi:putative phosphoesterase
MRVGLLSDVHANRVALEAVLKAMPPVERVVCAGDVIGYNPHPGECVSLVRERGWPTVQGNHDRVVRTPERYRHNEMARAGLAHARDHLSGEELDWLAGLPESRLLFDGRLRVVHSHPTETDRYVRPGAFPSLAPHLGEEEVLVLGHTHLPGNERVEDTLVVNPGSVGQPRDRDPRAAFAVLDLEAGTVEHHRVEYDIDRVQDDIVAAGLPERTATRLERGE